MPIYSFKKISQLNVNTNQLKKQPTHFKQPTINSSTSKKLNSTSNLILILYQIPT
jgi:hypothetical protein